MTVSTLVTSAPRTARGQGTASHWLSEQWHTLEWEGPHASLRKSSGQDALEGPEMDEKVAYLRKREGQMQYPHYLAAGWRMG